MNKSGFGMKFSPGYLSGGKTKDSAHEPEEEVGEGGHEDIHEHLRAQHEKTGHAHSHVEHHGDGTHTSHHIHESGEIEGPHEHPDTESMLQKMQEMGGEGGEPSQEEEQ